jgi:prophage regulatory protein
MSFKQKLLTTTALPGEAPGAAARPQIQSGQPGVDPREPHPDLKKRTPRHAGPPAEIDPILRRKHLPRMTGLSLSSIWRLRHEGTFPAPLELSAGAIGWPKSVIDEWKASRPRRNYPKRA